MESHERTKKTPNNYSELGLQGIEYCISFYNDHRNKKQILYTHYFSFFEYYINKLNSFLY